MVTVGHGDMRNRLLLPAVSAKQEFENQNNEQDDDENNDEVERSIVSPKNVGQL